MRIVVDTNVLMSAIFFGGVPGRILEAWKAGDVGFILSPAILDEYLDVGEELRRRHEKLEVLSLVCLIAARSELVADTELERPVSRDPVDDKFLACARAGGVRAIVSGDADVRSVREWEAIPILSPRQFVEAHL